MNGIEQAADAITNADAIFIGAGAGLSAAAGLDYNDEKAFAERFPGMLQYGARYQYQLMGYPFPDEALKWGYLSIALDHVYRSDENPVYQSLRRIVGERDCFVMTSNVDRFFHKNRFDPNSIYTPQGDYELFQCMTPCHDAGWDGKPQVKAMLPHLNRQTQYIEDRRKLPVCPKCGGPVFMNVRGGYWFIDKPYHAQNEALNHWLVSQRTRKLVLLEIGAGYNTPGVIRQPLEVIASKFVNATLIRINRDHADGPPGTISIADCASSTLSSLESILS